MNVVLDASVTLAWYFEDEASPLAQSLLERVDSINFVVPSLWLLEISNRLRVALRRGRIKDEKYYAYLQHAKTLNCDVDAGRWPQDIESINQLIIKYNLSPYDAWYLHLAQTRKIALATLDNDLHLAAKKAKVKLYAA